MNGKHLSRVTSLGIYLTLWLFSIYLVLQVPQFALLKLTITNKNTKSCKNHTEVWKCNAPNGSRKKSPRKKAPQTLNLNHP